MRLLKIDDLKGTAQRTVYKLACKRDGCARSVAGRKSKYEIFFSFFVSFR